LFLTNTVCSLTKVPPPPEPEGEALRKELKSGRIPVFNAEISRLKAFEHAAAAGVPVSTLKDERGRRAWEAYRAVAKEVEKYAKS
jgi:chromosome partitioning protein